jgi:hypothetical protein
MLGGREEEEGEKVIKMKRKPKKWTVLVLGILLFSSIATKSLANDLTRRLGIGLGWPYLSLKYGISPRFSIEGRGAFGEGIGVYGARLYYNFNPKDRAVIFTGLEGDYVNFDVEIEDEEEGMRGKGYVGYLFVGGEYFITDNFTFNLDIGPAYIDLTEDEFDLNVSGIEWLYNLGISFYFGSSKKEERPERPKEVAKETIPPLAPEATDDEDYTLKDSLEMRSP